MRSARSARTRRTVSAHPSAPVTVGTVAWAFLAALTSDALEIAPDALGSLENVMPILRIGERVLGDGRVDVFGGDDL